MIILSKISFSFSQNQRKVQVHRLRIPQLIKLLHRNEEIEPNDLTNINIQIINHINYINPNKIITNINKNVRTKDDLKYLKKKISFNYLLLREIVNNKHLQIYDFKKKENESVDSLLPIDDVGRITTQGYGRHKRKTKWKGTAGTETEANQIKAKKIGFNIDVDFNMKQNITDVVSCWNVKKKERFEYFDLTNNYNNFILENILKHICDYIYNFEKINELNKEETKSYETVSILCIANVFSNFFQIKYGYKYLLHFLNGINVYKLKRNINSMDLTLESFNRVFCESKESFFEKEYDISYIWDYLSDNEKRIEQLLMEEEKENVKNSNSVDTHKCLFKLRGNSKHMVYIFDVKKNILITYDFNKSFLYNSLYILFNKYNIHKMHFSNFCLLLLLYSISNKFVISFFEALPLLFVKNKILLNINNCIAVLNASIFFLKNGSYLPGFYACNIYSCHDKDRYDSPNKEITGNVGDIENSIEDSNMSSKRQKQKDEDDLNRLQENIYTLTEQIINYLFMSREVINVTQMLQLLEILSYIKYNKKLFTFIFNHINNMLCLLNKYQLLYFHHSLTNYEIVFETTKKNILIEIKKNVEQYTKEEIAQIEHNF